MDTTEPLRREEKKISHYGTPEAYTNSILDRWPTRSEGVDIERVNSCGSMLSERHLCA